MLIGHRDELPEIRSRVNTSRRDRHQTTKLFAETLAHNPYEAIGLLPRHTGFLGLVTDVYLHKQIRELPLTIGSIGKRICQLGPVEALDFVKQPHGIPCLVHLQRSDHVQTNTAMIRAQRRKFCRRRLNAIFAKHCLAGSNSPFNQAGVLAFRNCDQRNLTLACYRVDSRTKASEITRDIGNGICLGR